MPVSILSCNLSRDELKLAKITVDRANGTVGTYPQAYKIEMAAPCGPLELIERATTEGAPDRLPKLWDTYAFENDVDTQSYVKTYEISREAKSKRHCYVKLEFEPLLNGEQPDGGGDPIDKEPDPLKRKPRFWWDRELSNQIHTTDVDGNALITTAGTLFVDLAERTRSQAVLCAEFNVAGVADGVNLQRTYEDATNSTEWKFRGVSIPARSAFFSEAVGTTTKNEGQYSYQTFTMRIMFSPVGKTFDIMLPQMSQSFFTKTGGAYDLDAQGYRKRGNAGALVPLASDGTRLPDGTNPIVTPQPVIREVDFNQLTQLNR